MNAAGVEVQRSGQQVEHGALAGAVGPDQAENFAGRKIEAHLVDGDQPAEPADCALDAQERRIGRRAAAGARVDRACAGRFGCGLGNQRSTNGTMPLRAYCRKMMKRTENTTISSWPAAPLAINGSTSWMLFLRNVTRPEPTTAPRSSVAPPTMAIIR